MFISLPLFLFLPAETPPISSCSFPAGCSRGLCSLSCLTPQLKSFWPSTEPCPALCMTGLSFSSAAAVSRALNPSLVPARKGDEQHGEATPELGLSLSWPWSFSASNLASALALQEEKGSPETQATVLDWGGETGELGSLTMFRVYSHRSSPAPSECNCKDKVGAA